MQNLAREYYRAVHAAEDTHTDSEPEAQLTVPVQKLITEIVSCAELGKVQLIRETRLDGVRPDFAVLHTRDNRTHQKGYIELKAPTVSIDPETWTGRNKKQWEKLKEQAETIIICNGQTARLIINGVAYGEDAELPYQDYQNWKPEKLVTLLRKFIDSKPVKIESVKDLSKRLAIRTADLRDRILFIMNDADNAESQEAANQGFASWKLFVHAKATKHEFADGISQVIAYGLVLSALTADNIEDADGYISIRAARTALETVSPVMAAAFAPLVDKQKLYNATIVELQALETLISAIDKKKVNKSSDRRGEPWLYFYEDFLSVYDPEERKKAGVYYTPTPVVHAMTSIVDYILVNNFNIRLGFADPNVTVLDPATGTGTFPLAVIDAAVKRATETRGKAGPAQAAISLQRNLHAFELLPGAYSVAHLRLSQRLRDLSSSLVGSAKVVLTDTLESPENPQSQLTLFGAADVLASEQNRAKEIKLNQKITVVIGNPPYARVKQNETGRGSGQWVLTGRVPNRRNEKSLFSDILDVATANTQFSHVASLYNLYVYFWRWSIWEAFEAHGNGPGVVAFITGSSWLSGPGFMGLRKLAREHADEIYVIDLGGDSHGVPKEENVFAIQTPVSIVVLVRNNATEKRNQAKTFYKKITGTAKEKLEAVSEFSTSSNPLELFGSALEPVDILAPLVPETGSDLWDKCVKLTTLFPWQQPGCMHSRSWPISVDPSVLEKRWAAFVKSPIENRADLYVTPTHGRNIYTNVPGYKQLAALKAGDTHEKIVRFGYRSFDRQWTFEDPRLAKTESPALWASRSEKQIFIVCPMSEPVASGQLAVVSAHVPDKHYFKGRGGQDVLPLYRDASAKKPNLPIGILDLISTRLNTNCSPESIAAYVYCVLSSPKYYDKFVSELDTPGPRMRIPITAEPSAWEAAVKLGSRLIWLHTFAERFRSQGNANYGQYIKKSKAINWVCAITEIPENIECIKHNAEKDELYICDGIIGGVSADVWNYSVSGWNVVQRWLGYRTRKGAGKAASRGGLDAIKVTEWKDEWNDELLDLLSVLTETIELQKEQAEIFDKIVSGSLIDPAKIEALPGDTSVPRT